MAGVYCIRFATKCRHPCLNLQQNQSKKRFGSKSEEIWEFRDFRIEWARLQCAWGRIKHCPVTWHGSSREILSKILQRNPRGRPRYSMPVLEFYWVFDFREGRAATTLSYCPSRYTKGHDKVPRQSGLYIVWHLRFKNKGTGALGGNWALLGLTSNFDCTCLWKEGSTVTAGLSLTFNCSTDVYSIYICFRLRCHQKVGLPSYLIVFPSKSSEVRPASPRSSI
jgi:hypothetical protein